MDGKGWEWKGRDGMAGNIPIMDPVLLILPDADQIPARAVHNRTVIYCFLYLPGYGPVQYVQYV